MAHLVPIHTINGVLNSLLLIEVDVNGIPATFCLPAGSRVIIQADTSLPHLTTHEDMEEMEGVMQNLSEELGNDGEEWKQS